MKLQGEFDNLNAQLRDIDDFIKSRKANLAALENNINQSNDGFITSKGQRDRLQDERKWVLFLSAKVFWLDLFPPFFVNLNFCIVI